MLQPKMPHRAERERWQREWQDAEWRRWGEQKQRKLEESRWTANSLGRFARLLDWSLRYAVSLRAECHPTNLNDALSEAPLFQPGGNQSER